MLLHVWVSNVKVAALSSSKINRCSLLLEVDVSIVSHHSLRLVEGLSHATGAGEGVWSCGSAHVRILPFQSLSVNCNGSRLRVIALRNSITQFLVCSLGSASEHACFDNELIITVLSSDQLAVLSLHDLAANCICSHILGH